MRTRWLKSLQLVTPCWLCVTLAPRSVTSEIERAFESMGLHPLSDAPQSFGISVNENWSITWRKIAATLNRFQLAPDVQIAIIAGEETPVLQEVIYHHKTFEETEEIADAMWLIDAIEQKRLVCTYLPVVDRRGEIFGYEALVRGTLEDGSSVNGGQIFKASHTLLLEYLVDKHLHETAVRGFVENRLNGFLFINFVPGFIQRPEFYLDGLSQAATRYHLNPKQIVLDCTNSENPKDIQHLKSIFKYCRTKGYQIALDDIESFHSARRILNEISPDFIKLDMRLVRRVLEKENLLSASKQPGELQWHTSGDAQQFAVVRKLLWP